MAEVTIDRTVTSVSRERHYEEKRCQFEFNATLV